MGIKDRDYFQEDRKRREKLLEKDVYFKSGSQAHTGFAPPARSNVSLVGLLVGALLGCLATLATLILRPAWLTLPFTFVRCCWKPWVSLDSRAHRFH
jgi:hypothetical protein